jgi:hypothetical protein
MPQRCVPRSGRRKEAAIPLDWFVVKKLTGLALLVSAFPGPKRLWRCKECNACLGALDLQDGCVGVATFDLEREYLYDRKGRRLLHTIGLVLTSQQTKDRHEIKCEYCGVVNRWRRGG